MSRADCAAYLPTCYPFIWHPTFIIFFGSYAYQYISQVQSVDLPNLMHIRSTVLKICSNKQNQSPKMTLRFSLFLHSLDQRKGTKCMLWTLNRGRFLTNLWSRSSGSKRAPIITKNSREIQSTKSFCSAILGTWIKLLFSRSFVSELSVGTFALFSADDLGTSIYCRYTFVTIVLSNLTNIKYCKSVRS